MLPELIKEVLALDGKIEELARGLKSARSMLVMGRGYNYATCLEGALVSGQAGMARGVSSIAICRCLECGEKKRCRLESSCATLRCFCR